MFLRILIALFTAMIMSMFVYLKPTTFFVTTQDNNNIRILHMLDSKIVEYYLNHVDADSAKVSSDSNGLNRVDVVSGILPETLDSDILYGMGLERIDPSIYEYHKVAENKFTLTYTKKGDNIIVSSKNSNKPLGKVQVVVW